MIIGLIGFAQVGKSTAAKHLEGRGFVRINMKDALVAELRKNFPLLLSALSEIYHLTEDELFEQKPLAMRSLMRNYGTEVRRGDNTNYWTTQWRLKCSEAYRAGESVVVDDVRFLNEAEAVRQQGGILIRLTRPDIATGGDHASETEQLEIVADHTIECPPGEHGILYNALDEIISPK